MPIKSKPAKSKPSKADLMQIFASDQDVTPRKSNPVPPFLAYRTGPERKYKSVLHPIIPHVEAPADLSPVDQKWYCFFATVYSLAHQVLDFRASLTGEEADWAAQDAVDDQVAYEMLMEWVANEKIRKQAAE